jgi:hypothetical protein
MVSTDATSLDFQFRKGSVAYGWRRRLLRPQTRLLVFDSVRIEGGRLRYSVAAIGVDMMRFSFG